MLGEYVLVCVQRCDVEWCVVLRDQQDQDRVDRELAVPRLHVELS